MCDIGAVIGGAVSLIGAKSASDANKKAAQAQSNATDQAAQLQREQMARAEGLNQPYIDRGVSAQSRLDALYGLPGGFTPGMSTTAPDIGPDGQIPEGYNLDWGAYWGNTTGGKTLAQHAAGDANFARYLAQKRASGDTRSDAEIHYEYGGHAAGSMLSSYLKPDGSAAADPANAISREEALAPFYDTYEYKLASDVYTGAQDRIDEGYNAQAAQLTANRADMESGYLRDLRTRQGYTDAAISAYDQVSATDRERALMQLQAQGLGSGQLGKWARANADQASYQAAKYGDTVRTYRNQDYNPYADGMEQAAQAYGSGALANVGEKANRYLTNWSNYGGARSGAYNTYTGYLQNAADTGFNARQNIVNLGQTSANNIGELITQGAGAQAQGYMNNANIWGAAGNSVAETVGGAWDSYNKKKSKDPQIMWT